MSYATPTISIIVPVKNEAWNLREVLPQLPAVHEVIVVDAHSVDGSAEVAREVLPSCRVITQTRRGKGNALACGFEAATGDIIVMFDADGSADPAEIDAFVTCLLEGADFAKGTRFRHGGGSTDITALRRIGNAALNGIANALFGTQYSDLCYGYNAFWRHVVPVLALPATDLETPAGDGMIWGDGFEIETVINTRIAVADLDIREVGSHERDRIHGESNLRTFHDGFRVLRTLLAERRNAKTIAAHTPHTTPKTATTDHRPTVTVELAQAPAVGTDPGIAMLPAVPEQVRLLVEAARVTHVQNAGAPAAEGLYVA